ncbi:reactivating factor of adenosylcobalamin-dependent ethanolamine ammonia lyase [Lachnotalea glycerini]|uniref:Reactivating factor of adenosylcobalamin-dependent ethanolamine ammonia lyase n=1 Tax=Lachnotalea glycerini TaxID=1763509 RepID=A0A318EV21_9FIRM|nr:ethanolamine ammonia-lyase reactivating factor EutA [Lachnotalea glycerini]PXV93603.1 reactivating factor of adenosylcobalamin-dependent ethanolamine ammonia lyase [Lachnotalea glycerini]
MQEIIISVGIDIGTSTTQLIFSRITIENLASSYTVPRISIVNKEVIYRSEIYFTPLKSLTEIDANEIERIVKQEYKNAGITPEMLKTGAVIITGETARKKNADEVLKKLSNLAGDFVVATAGPDLESVLSAKGAGSDKLSKEEKLTVANLDIGGGTTNIAVFKKGIIAATSCLDIGGRLIKIEDGKISYIYPKIKELAQSNQIHIEVGEKAEVDKLEQICTLMAEQLSMAINRSTRTNQHAGIYTNEGKPLPEELEIQGLTFSGGVADYVYHPADDDWFRYGDIGVLLGKAILKNDGIKKVQQFQAVETIRATVVGAGTHTTEVSGSTITYERERLPIKNMPVLKIPEEEEMDLEAVTASLIKQIPLFYTEGKLEQLVIALSGNFHTSFASVQELAEAILKGSQEIVKSEFPIVIAVENDIGKVLGNAIKVMLECRKDVVCIDGIHAGSGDYLDIGEPIANGRVVPVVTKTLIFNS